MGQGKQKPPTPPLAKRETTGNMLTDFVNLDLTRPSKIRAFFRRWPCPSEAPHWAERKMDGGPFVTLGSGEAFHVDDLGKLPDPLPPDQPEDDEQAEREQSHALLDELDDLAADADAQDQWAEFYPPAWEELEAGKQTSMGRLGLDLANGYSRPDDVANMRKAIRAMGELQAEFARILAELIAWTAGLVSGFDGSLRWLACNMQGNPGFLGMQGWDCPGLALTIDSGRRRVSLGYKGIGYLEHHLFSVLLDLVTISPAGTADLSVNERKAGGVPELLYRCDNCKLFGWKVDDQPMVYWSEASRSAARRRRLAARRLP